MKKTWKERAELAEAALEAIRKSTKAKAPENVTQEDSYRLGRIDSHLWCYDQGIKQ